MQKNISFTLHQNQPAIFKTCLIKAAIFFLLITLTTIEVTALLEKVPSNQNTLFKPDWIYKTQTANKSIASDNESSLFIINFENKILSIDVKTGEKIWESDMSGEAVSELLAGKYRKNLYIATKTVNPNLSSNGFVLTAFSQSTGLVNWSLKLNEDSAGKIFLGFSGNNIVMKTPGNIIFLVDYSNGKIIRQVKIPTENSVANDDIFFNDNIFFLENNYFVCLIDNYLHCLSLSDDQPNKIQSTNLKKLSEYKISSAILLNVEALIVGDERGMVRKLNPADKNDRWKSLLGGKINDIKEINDSSLIISSLDNFVYSVSVKSGKVNWKRRLEGRPAGEILVVDETAFVSIIGSPKILVLDTGSGRVINSLYLPSDTHQILSSYNIKNRLFFQTRNGIFSFLFDKSENIVTNNN